MRFSPLLVTLKLKLKSEEKLIDAKTHLCFCHFFFFFFAGPNKITLKNYALPSLSRSKEVKKKTSKTFKKREAKKKSERVVTSRV